MLKGAEVAIIGAGFSGSLLAINLLRHDGPRATLIERRPDRLARGVAYGTARQEHLLNVRASNMSAFPDQPDHFTSWLAARGLDASGFAERRTYGLYLKDLLDQAIMSAPHRLRIIEGEAVGLDGVGAQSRVQLADGTAVAADTVVLAQGNLPPHPLPHFGDLGDKVYVADPWAGDIAGGLSAHDSVLLIGTGLTAIDVAMTLDFAGFRGCIMALSRRGLVPRRHELAGPPPAREDRPRQSGAHLVAHVRRRAAIVGWRAAIDELRPYTQDIWRAASVDQQARFLRHLRPWWDVHRHRIAPPVAERIDAMTGEGRLSFSAGQILATHPRDAGTQVVWRPRGTTEGRNMLVSRIINCTGPQGDVQRSTDALLRQLVDTGLIRPDRLHLGIDVDARGRALRRDGGADDRLLAIGPMTRGAHWEIVAVPDLRQQAWTLARRLSVAHWVEGEGL
jgi:uncharacterized NAD(P)/FAD-binding protein YdhS